MKRNRLILCALALVIAMLCTGLTGCDEPKDELQKDPTTQATTQPATQPSEPTTPSDPAQEIPGSESGIVERDPTQPTDPVDPTVPTDPTDPTNPTEPPKEETKPTEGDKPVEPPKEDGDEMTYKKYEALSEEDKAAFRNTFATRKEFLNWYKTAKQAYEDSQQKVTIGPGEGLNIGDYIK